MSEYIHFIAPKNLTAPSGGTSGVCGFVTSQEVIAATVSASTNADWITLDTQYLSQNSFIYRVAPNDTGVERTAVISIAAKVQEEGAAYLMTDYDIATLRQAAQGQQGGSILPNYTTFTPKAEGDSGVCTFTTANVVKSSIGIHCDQPYVTINYLTDNQGYKTGFTWSVPENAEATSRQFTITISAKRSSSDGYAYAYVTGTQPSINDVGFIYFQYDTIRASASTLNGSISFNTEYVPHITSAYTSQYWLHATFIDVQSGQTEGEYDGQLDYVVDENFYNEPRIGTLTIFGVSEIDGSVQQSTLHFYQAANEYGGPQTGFIYADPVKYMGHPEAVTDFFELSYAGNVNRNEVRVKSFSGNLSGTPQLSAEGTVLTFGLNNATSTYDYTMSQIWVGAEDTSGRTIPPIVLTVLQPPYIEYVEFPIWSDTDLVIPSPSDYLLYKIIINDEIIYAGRAFAMDGNVTIRLNEIMAQVLQPDIDLSYEGLQDNRAYANATLYISPDGVDYQKYKQIKTYADWSYKPQKNNILSKPIKNVLDRRQLFVNTAMDYAGNGPTVIVTSFDTSGNVNDIVYTLSNNIGTVVQSLGDTTNITVEAGEAEMEYKVVDGCERYCIYYLNAVGGWDSFIFNKTSKENDNFERKTYKRNINNNKPVHSTVEYRTKVKKEWVLNTGFLNDSQSINFAQNLVGSPKAYLHDLEENEIYPVLINTNRVDYQTFIRNGRKFSKYSLNVQLAQDRFRS